MRSGSLAYQPTLSVAEASVSDAELLARFAEPGDGSAFELLVRRHAELVWRVCQSELPQDRHSAEDAFQTTFLVLVRKAGSVRGGTVAGYLFRVDRNAAFRVRNWIGKVVEPIHDVASEPFEPSECSIAVIEEVERLPDKFRLPVLLCFFEDCTHTEAANRLGWAVGTVASRLARAKDRLRIRLTHRGLALPAVLAGAGVSATTVRAAATMATTPSAVPTLLTELSREVLTAMANTNAKWIGAGVLATLLLPGGLGIMVLTAGSAPDEPKPGAKDKPVAKAPEKETPEAVELKKLQGVWRVTKIETNRGVAPAKVIEPMRWEIVGSTVTAINDPDMKQKDKSSIALDVTKSPKRITQTALTGPKDEPGRKIEGIYEVKDDKLRICFGEERKAFPTEFKVEKGVEMGLIELERIPKPAEKETPEAADLKKLQGTWRVTRIVNERGVAPAEEIEPMRWEFVGTTFNGPDEFQKKTPFTLDLTKSPKQMTTTLLDEANGKITETSIYELKGDTLRICSLKGGKLLPTEFKTEKGIDGMLIELERVKKK